MKPQRILYIAKTSKGGSAFSLYHLAKGLDNRRYIPLVLFYAQQNSYIEEKMAADGMEVLTIAKQQSGAIASTEPVKPRDIHAWLNDHFGHWAGEIYIFLKGLYQFLRNDLPKIKPLVRVIRENNINLIHINNSLSHSKPGAIAAWLTRKPCICHVRVFDTLEFFDKSFDRFVNHYVYISKSVAENYIAQGIPASKGTTIHNAVELAEFSQPYDTARVRSEFGWTKQAFIIGVVGRLDWWKGHEYFLQAMAEVCQKAPEARAIIVGAPESSAQNHLYYQRLQELRTALHLEDKVNFTGFRSDVPRLMAALDVVVLSSSEPEPFGRVVIEGMAAGKPVVATAAGGVLDIITHQINGILVPCKDAGAMAQAILELFNDPEHSSRIGLAARENVEKRFTIERHVSALQSVYSTVLHLSSSQDWDSRRFLEEVGE